MAQFQLEYYYQGVVKGCECINAPDEKEARRESWNTKIAFSTTLKDAEGNMVDHRKISVKIKPVIEKRKPELEKGKLNDNFKWY